MYFNGINNGGFSLATNTNITNGAVVIPAMGTYMIIISGYSVPQTLNINTTLAIQNSTKGADLVSGIYWSGPSAGTMSYIQGNFALNTITTCNASDQICFPYTYLYANTSYATSFNITIVRLC